MEADFIIVKSRNGQLTLHDMYSTGYGPPREDSEQNVYTPTVVGTHVNGMLRAQFTRKRDTGDRKADHRFSDTTCYKFLFPVSGGRLDAVSEFPSVFLFFNNSCGNIRFNSRYIALSAVCSDKLATSG
ncbi:unnamed protein product [Anisakis simplex]|uniref:DOMON domain-containing protein n=1 Tax=Anisakis simplex TaxID=6269 RepID=A0A0M3JM21_ANISI|nr:unnamed protein product [Anisakis simplex]